jgi:hypothetical protein
LNASCNSALETIDSDAEEEPLPMSYFVSTKFREPIKDVNVEMGRRESEYSRHTHCSDSKYTHCSDGSKHTFHSDPFKSDVDAGSNTAYNDERLSSNDNLAVATPVDESDEQGTIYEAKKYSPTLTISKYKTQKNIGLTLALLLVISVGVALGVTYGTKSIEEERVQSEVIYVTASPTRALTLAPTSAREVALSTVIEKSVLQRNAKFSTMSDDDPRILALDWILHADELKIDANDPSLKQRYTLALIAFQFDYLAWFNDAMNVTSDGTLDWLSSTNECEWYGLSCRDGQVTEINLCKWRPCNIHMHTLLFITSRTLTFHYT